MGLYPTVNWEYFDSAMVKVWFMVFVGSSLAQLYAVLTWLAQLLLQTSLFLMQDIPNIMVTLYVPSIGLVEVMFPFANTIVRFSLQLKQLA